MVPEALIALKAAKELDKSIDLLINIAKKRAERALPEMESQGRVR